MSDRFRNPCSDTPPSSGLLDGDVVEVPLLLPGWEMTALETAAHDYGLTAAEMVRHLLRDFIARLPESAGDSGILRKNRIQHL